MGLISEATGWHFNVNREWPVKCCRDKVFQLGMGELFFSYRERPHEILQGRNVGARSGRELIVNLE